MKVYSFLARVRTSTRLHSDMAFDLCQCAIQAIASFLREVARASDEVTGLRDRKLICLTVDFGFILKIFCNFWLGGSTVSYLRTYVLGEKEKFARN